MSTLARLCRSDSARCDSVDSSFSLSLSSCTPEDDAWIREALGRQLFALPVPVSTVPVRVRCRLEGTKNTLKRRVI
jgi:hypothetical protein